MNIWSGAIALDEKIQLRGLELIDLSTSWQSDIHKDTVLAFRSFVNPALIPLYARVGPNLELHTTDPETSRWFKHKFLGNLWLEDEDLDRFQTTQCPIGLLLSTNGASQPKPPGWATTDLLVHGVLSTTIPVERPPTPPKSSSPEVDEPAPHVIKQELRIYATPISSFLISKAQALPPPQESDALEGYEDAHFLPNLHSPSPKRKRVTTLFESVAQHHKRVRQQGGEAVSQLMAHSHSHSLSSQQLQPLNIKRESEEPSLPILSRIASHRSRSHSVSNLNPARALEHRAENPRPSSNRGHARGLVSRRNTPVPLTDFASRKDRDASPTLFSSEGKREPSESPKDTETIISENKNTITRTILTCMRLYGFNRTAPRSSSSNKPLSNHHEMTPSNLEVKDTQITATHSTNLSTSMASSDEDEFKVMYHATYRASTFALRKYLKEPPAGEDGSQPLPTLLERGKAMIYIDEFLRLFCEEDN